MHKAKVLMIASLQEENDQTHGFVAFYRPTECVHYTLKFISVKYNRNFFLVWPHPSNKLPTDKVLIISAGTLLSSFIFS